MPRFVLTDELGRLARWLRLMGYDTVVMSLAQLPELYARAVREERVVVARTSKIGPSCLFRVVRLESAKLEAQLAQLVRELGLRAHPPQAFTRCDRCNAALEPVDKAAVQERVPAYVYETQQAFTRCPSCQRVYWAATHLRRIAAVLERLGA